MICVKLSVCYTKIVFTFNVLHMKKLFALAVVPAFLLIAGAGCQEESAVPVATSPAVTITAPTAPGISPEEFNFKAEVLNPGIVHFTWDAPKNMDSKTETFLILHSAFDAPKYPGAFWYRRSGVDREGVWGNIPAGKRYFRICESKDEKCIGYSKTVELNIPAAE